MSTLGTEPMSGAAPGEEERNRLIVEHLPLVHHVLGRLPLRLPATLDRDDLFETGVLGLMNAASSYNPAKGATFKTFAYVNIRGAILDEIRRHDPVPRSRRDRLRQVATIEQELEIELGRKPSPEEIADRAELTIEQVEDSLVNAHGMAVLSLEEPTGGEAASRLIDGLRMPESPNPSTEVARRELLERLMEAIRDLPERDRQVLVLYYGHELRLKEIGEILEITESRVSQLHTRAIRSLYERLRDRAVNQGQDKASTRPRRPGTRETDPSMSLARNAGQ